MQQLGLGANVRIPHTTPMTPFPRMPLDVHDDQIYTDYISPQQAGTASIVAAPNASAEFHKSYELLAAVDRMYGTTFHDYQKVKDAAAEGLRKCKQVYSTLPALLLEAPKAGSSTHDPFAQDAERRVFQEFDPSVLINDWPFQMQRCGLTLDYLSTRVYLLKRYLTATLNSKQNGERAVPDGGHGPDLQDDEFASERDLIAQDLLQVLDQLVHSNIEALEGHAVRH